MFNALTIGFFSLGLIGVLASLPLLLRSIASKSWRTTDAVVLESTLDISDSRQSGLGSFSTVYPHVVFEYTVNNKKYKSTKVAVHRGWSETEARKYPEKYPVGCSVTAYFNPKKPSEAVLEPGFHGSGFLGFYVSAIFMLMGAYWMFL